MSDRFVVGFPAGRWQTNCYVIGDRAAGGCVLVDPGETAAGTVTAIVEQLQVRCEAILLSHGHLDHIWDVPALARDLDVPVFLHPEDRWLWDDPTGIFGGGLPAAAVDEFLGGPWDPPDERLQDLADGDRLTFAGIAFDAAHTPGHTPGHVTFLARGLSDADVQLGRAPLDPGASGILFSGDLLFAGSVGRTDFPRGSWEEQMASLARTVLPLEDDVLVLSGHGPETTVGRERRSNPFLAELVRRP